MRHHLALACAAGVWALAALAVAAAESPDARVFLDFQRDYSLAKTADARAGVVRGSAGFQSKTMFQAMVNITRMDRDAVVRQAAFEAITGYPECEDGSVARHAVQSWLAERDRDTKVALAGALSGLRLKGDALSELVRFLNGLQYPDLPRETSGPAGTGGGGGVGGANTNRGARELAEKARMQFEAVLRAINQAGGQNFQPSRTVRSDVGKWWTMSAANFGRADAETLKQLKAEGEQRKKADAEEHKKAEAAKAGTAKTETPPGEKP